MAAMEHRLFFLNPFSATRRYKCHQNKVKVKGLSRKSSFLAGFFIFLHGCTKKFNQLAKKELLKIFLSSIKTKVTIKFLKVYFLFYFFFFFLPKIRLTLKELKVPLTSYQPTFSVKWITRSG